MTTKIRTVRVEEFEDFMRYVERAFGHSVDFFRHFGPHIYKPTPEVCAWGYVVEENGKIVSHVGVYPLEVVTASVPLRLGGIGAVSTAVEARGKGYMSRLLHHAINEMRAQGYPASWLGGDRQRYNSFGWEVAALSYQLIFSERSLGRANVAPAAIEEVRPWEAAAHIARLMPLPDCHACRPDLEAQLHRQNLRVWVTDDGYAIANGQDRDHVKLIELVSASGKEAEIIRAIITWNHGEAAMWELSVWDETRIARVMPHVSYWKTGYSNMYRINDLTAVLRAALPWFERRAAGLRDFVVMLGLREHDRTQTTTIAVRDGVAQVEAGRHAEHDAEHYIELDSLSATRLIFGGPAILEAPQLPPGLLALLPVPVYVPQLDHV
jgi:predicted N-acetyltransferase YhbS